MTAVWRLADESAGRFKATGAGELAFIELTRYCREAKLQAVAGFFNRTALLGVESELAGVEVDRAVRARD